MARTSRCLSASNIRTSSICVEILFIFKECQFKTTFFGIRQLIVELSISGIESVQTFQLVAEVVLTNQTVDSVTGLTMGNNFSIRS